MKSKQVATPKISVIIPTYNSTRFLEATLQSVLSQTLAPTEIIVVDDESRDNTVNLIERLRELSPLIKLIQQPNAGTQAARNNGIRHSTGDFIALLDHDDCWLPDYLARMSSFLAPRWITFANYQIIDGEGKITNLCKRVRAAEMKLPQVLFGNQVLLSGTLFSRQLWNEVGAFDDKLIGTGDWDWLVRAILAGAEIYHVPKVLWQYRLHNANTTRNVKLMTENAVQVIEKTFERGDLPQQLHQFKPYAFYLTYITGVAKFYATDDLVTAVEYLKRSYQASPADFFSLQTFISFFKVYVQTGTYDLIKTNEEAVEFLVEQAQSQQERRILKGLARLTLALLIFRQRPELALSQIFRALRSYPQLPLYSGLYRTILRYSFIYFREVSHRLRQLHLLNTIGKI